MIGGNNKMIKYGCKSKPIADIKSNNNKKVFEVFYIDITRPIGEFILEGELINTCKGEWKIYFTDEEIENIVPLYYKKNKEEFKNITINIIKKYER